MAIVVVNTGEWMPFDDAVGVGRVEVFYGPSNLGVVDATLAVLAGMHDHALVARPDAAAWTTDVTDTERLALGVVDVKTEAHLLHEEHGGIGLAPGRYCLRASREQATIIRRVAD